MTYDVHWSTAKRFGMVAVDGVNTPLQAEKKAKKILREEDGLSRVKITEVK